MLKKISQVTAYIALGLVIVVLMLGVFLKFSLVTKEIKSKPQKENKKTSDPRTDVIYLVKRCIEKETEKALYLAAKQGNTINISKWKNNGKFIYWFYWNDSILLNKSSPLNFTEKDNYYFYNVFIEKIPTLENLSEELSGYLIKKIDKCIRGFQVVRKKYDIFISYKINNVTVTFFNESVKVKVEMPITIYDPKNNKIDKKTNEFVEEIKIPYKRDYLKLKELFEKVMSQGLYGYYYLFLTGTSDKIPYGILKYNCDKLEISVNEIKNEIEKILKKTHDICYSNCKYLYSPYNSFDSDIRIYLPNYIKTITNFYSIKYFDVYLDYEVNDSEKRYYFGNSKVENNKIIIIGQNPEEYYKLSNLEFDLGKVCSLTVFYDLILNGSLTFIDNSLRKPLVFNIMFDFGLLNSRPITLATYKQPKNSLQWFYINESSKKYFLWPRRAETVFYKDSRSNVNYFLNYNLDFELINVKHINDGFIEFKGFNSYSFCYPFFVRRFSDKIPLLTYCSDGSVVIKNKTKFIVLNKEHLINFGFYDKNEFSPKSVVILGHYSSRMFKNELLNNMAEKKKYNFSIVTVNKQIIDIFKNESLLNSKFLELNNEVIVKVLLSPTIYNPENEKISLDENLNISEKSYDIEKEAFILKKGSFNLSYYYGSAMNFVNLSLLEKEFKTHSYLLNFTNLINYSVRFIPISVYGNKISFKRLNNNLIFPIVYDYLYFLRLNDNLSSLNTKIFLIVQLLDVSPLSDNYLTNSKFIEEFKKAIEDGFKKNNLEINISKEFGKEISEYLVNRVNQIKKLCLGKYWYVSFNTNKSVFWDCLKKYIPEIFGFGITGVLLTNNLYFTNNISILSEKFTTYNNHLNYQTEDIMKCVRNSPIDSCVEYFKEQKTLLDLNKEKYNEMLSNPLFFMRQKGLLNGTDFVKPFFGKDFVYKGSISLNLEETELRLLDLKSLLITKAECITDNGKVEMFYSNYGLNSWNFKTKLPIGSCNYISKLIYSYNKLKKLKNFIILVDNSVNIPMELKKYLQTIANLFNLQYLEANPINEIRNNFFINCSNLLNNFLVLTNNNQNLFNFLNSECNHKGTIKIIVLDLGQNFQDNDVNLFLTKIFGIFPISEKELVFSNLLLEYLNLLGFVKVNKTTEKVITNKYTDFSITIKKEIVNNEVNVKAVIS